MTNEQILKKVLEIVIENDYDKITSLKQLFNKELNPGRDRESEKLIDTIIEDWLRNNYYYAVIFSHDFAKAFWGTGKKMGTKTSTEGTHYTYIKDNIEYHLPIWQYHLQQMVLEVEPLKYLQQFLED